MKSERVKLFFTQYNHMRKKHPKAKPVVFSIFLRFLDILARIFELRYRIKAFRYDGTVPQGMRSVVETEYAEASAGVPLLLTATCGGYGLNIVSANYVFQCEPWWTSSLELQALSRCHRQGQEQIVYHKLLHAENSEVDRFIMQTRDVKDEVNELVLQPLIRGLDEGPADIDYRVALSKYDYILKVQDYVGHDSGIIFPEFSSTLQRELDEAEAKGVNDIWAVPGTHTNTEGSESNMPLDSSTSQRHLRGSSNGVEEFHGGDDQGGPPEASNGREGDEVGKESTSHHNHDDMMDLDHDEHHGEGLGGTESDVGDEESNIPDHHDGNDAHDDFMQDQESGLLEHRDGNDVLRDRLQNLSSQTNTLPAGLSFSNEDLQEMLADFIAKRCRDT